MEEERNRLKLLRQEEEVKKQVMSEKLKTLTEQIRNLSSTISDIETTLKDEDLPFLMVLFMLVPASVVSTSTDSCSLSLL